MTEVRPALIEKRKYQNVHQVPRLEKIVVNMGVSASLEKGAIDDAAKDLSQIKRLRIYTDKTDQFEAKKKYLFTVKIKGNAPAGHRRVRSAPTPATPSMAGRGAARRLGTPAGGRGVLAFVRKVRLSISPRERLLACFLPFHDRRGAHCEADN